MCKILARGRIVLIESIGQAEEMQGVKMWYKLIKAEDANKIYSLSGQEVIELWWVVLFEGYADVSFELNLLVKVELSS